MNKIIFFTIVFTFISFTNIKALEIPKEKILFEQAKNQLSKYCYKCTDKSLQEFEKATMELEKIFQIKSQENKSIDEEILLIDSYEQLIYGFYTNNKAKQITYRNKQYRLLEKILNNVKTEKEKLMLWRKLSQINSKAKNYAVNYNGSDMTDASQNLFKYMINLRKLLNSPQLYINNTNPQVYIENKNALEIKLVNRRAKYKIMSNEDRIFIDGLLDELYILNPRSRKNKELYFEATVNTLLSIVSSNNLSQERLAKISRSALILKIHYLAEKFKNKIDDIIWWSEVRSIDDKKQQLQFLNNQMLSTRKLDALKMLIELGEVETIDKWSKKLNFENSQMIFKLAIRQAKLRQATLQKDKKLAQLLQQQLSQSITEIIQNKLIDEPQYQQHVQWLIIQIGTLKQDNDFKKILENLAKDNLFYNKNLTKNLSQKEIKQLSNEIETKLKISDDADFCMN